MRCHNVNKRFSNYSGSHVLVRVCEKITREREKTSIIVMMCLYPYHGGRFGRVSTSKHFSDPTVNSVLLSFLGRICLVSFPLLAMQSEQLVTQARIFSSNAG